MLIANRALSTLRRLPLKQGVILSIKKNTIDKYLTGGTILPKKSSRHIVKFLISFQLEQIYTCHYFLRKAFLTANKYRLL